MGVGAWGGDGQGGTTTIARSLVFLLQVDTTSKMVGEERGEEKRKDEEREKKRE